MEVECPKVEDSMYFTVDLLSVGIINTWKYATVSFLIHLIFFPTIFSHYIKFVLSCVTKIFSAIEDGVSLSYLHRSLTFASPLMIL
jgi:hypothetical protein